MNLEWRLRRSGSDAGKDCMTEFVACTIFIRQGQESAIERIDPWRAGAQHRPLHSLFNGGEHASDTHHAYFFSSL
jgi:hypothetical protein